MIKLKDVLSKGIAGIASSGQKAEEKKDSPKRIAENFTIDNFITNNNPIVKRIEEKEEGEENKNPMKSISGRVKISGSTSGLTIQKIDDEDEDSQEEEIQVPANISSQPVIIIQRPQDVLRKWAQLSQIHLETLTFVEKSLNETSGFIDHNTQKIVQKANSLAESTRIQGNKLQEAIEVLGEINLTADSISISDALSRINIENRKNLGKILLLEKHISSALINLTNAKEGLGEMEIFVHKIEKITRQTNLLAKNASKESSKNDEDSKGFEVIINKTRSLAKDMADLSVEMANKISNFVTNVDISYSNIKEANVVGENNDSICTEEILHGIMRQNVGTCRLLQEGVVSLDKISNSLAAVHEEMAFANNSSDNISDMGNALSILAGQISEYKHTAVGSLGMKLSKKDTEIAAIERILSGLTLDATKRDFILQLISEGYIESEASISCKELDADTDKTS